MPFKYGALPRDFSRPAPTLETYLTDVRAFGAADPLPKSPAFVDRLSKIQTIPMYMNDSIGDCTVACVLHIIESWEVYAGRATDGGLFTDAEAVKIYSAVSGYDPVTGANDNGATLQAVCQYMVKTGAVDKNGTVHKFGGWAEIGDYTNLPLLKRVLNAFGPVDLAIQVPASAQPQFFADQPWTPVPGSPIEGGHSIPLAYSAVNTGTWDDEEVETWGSRQKMNEAFAHDYLSEAVAVIGPDAINPLTGENPAGLAWEQLVEDCQTKYLV